MVPGVRGASVQQAGARRQGGGERGESLAIRLHGELTVNALPETDLRESWDSGELLGSTVSHRGPSGATGAREEPKGVRPPALRAVRCADDVGRRVGDVLCETRKDPSRQGEHSLTATGLTDDQQPGPGVRTGTY
ncbi:hypothetical protein GCM10010254_31000 [Streptomyces chromofuscus]|nr:hypothetical protein GCM10010254_31000 [Streptomyces chromofuscus]